MTPWSAAPHASLVHHQLPELTQTHVIDSVMSSNTLILCHPFSSHLLSFPGSGSFEISQFFASGGQSTGVSASASVLPMNTQDLSPLGWTGWISLQSRDSQALLQHHSSTPSILWCSAFFIVQLSHPYMTTGKTKTFTRPTFVGKVMSLLFSMLIMAFHQGVSIF